jgi:hypothetical protein
MQVLYKVLRTTKLARWGSSIRVTHLCRGLSDHLYCPLLAGDMLMNSAQSCTDRRKVGQVGQVGQVGVLS